MPQLGSPLEQRIGLDHPAGMPVGEPRLDASKREPFTAEPIEHVAVTGALVWRPEPELHLYPPDMSQRLSRPIKGLRLVPLEVELERDPTFEPQRVNRHDTD